ncbi:MAG TPA: class I SAM-dependent methyltransferase [Steroidobacteraceae bacterium]|nr:class I SAM-dependent methyltransferase [Steroidobacteraceae bacterium]
MSRAAVRSRASGARRRARHLYYRARLNRLLGRTRRAAELCQHALTHCDYGRAYRLLAELELPGADYLRVLSRVHEHVRPATYVEIGVAKGDSLRLLHKDTTAIGIDPQPRLARAPGPRQKVLAKTSDEYFAKHDVIAELGGQRVRMAFIDGMHHFEFALRDFINLEPLCAPDSLIFVHDCYPLDERSATREQHTAFWSGDVWRLIVLLKKHRPDLAIHTIATAPTGLGLITHLDPSSRTLRQNLPALIAEGLSISFDSIAGRKAEALNLFPNAWDRLRGLLS